MAELVPEAWFYGDANLDPMKAADWNFELMDRLGTSHPDRLNMKVAKAFMRRLLRGESRHPPHRPMTEKPATVNPRGLSRRGSAV